MGDAKPTAGPLEALEFLCLGTQDSPGAAEGLPHPAGSRCPLTPCSWRAGLLTQVLLPHSGMLVLGPRQCGNRIRAAGQRLSARPRNAAGRGSCRSIPASPLPLSSPAKDQSLQFTLRRALGTAHQLPLKCSQRGFTLPPHFPPHPNKSFFPPPWHDRGRSRLLMAGESRAAVKPGEGGCREAAGAFPSCAKQKALRRQGRINHRTFQA